MKASQLDLDPDPERDHVINRLETFGFDIQPIPKSEVQGEESPDIRLYDGSELILIEVKTKRDPKGYAEKLMHELGREGEAVFNDSLQKKRPLEREAKKAHGQLTAHNESNISVHVL